ncbi:hypothetical protein [uncultured Paraglaciecola sp.]|uniref:hypothetical protein n=1 Tax=uncultured Paraglaciecola sp. TaxID=1765024 RepID=UPI0026280BE3|nr:hypothetical protein [uncultured Paraglaciecola sp.]
MTDNELIAKISEKILGYREGSTTNILFSIDAMQDRDATLWIGAFRYYCGRMTISVSGFCETMINNIENIPKEAISIIKRDLMEAFADDDRDRGIGNDVKRLGMDCDRQKWLEVLAAISGA